MSGPLVVFFSVSLAGGSYGVIFLGLKANKGFKFVVCFCERTFLVTFGLTIQGHWGIWLNFSGLRQNPEERFPDGRLLCNGTDACSSGTGELEFKSSSDYLDCRGCLGMDLNKQCPYCFDSFSSFL